MSEREGGHEACVDVVQDVGDDADGPNVDGIGVDLAHDDLGRHVARCTALSLQQLATSKELGESKVRDHDASALADEKVLGLEVAVRDAVAVQIRHASENLTHTHVSTTHVCVVLS